MNLSDLKSKLPKLGRGGSVTKPDLKPPQFLSDLYWDLRDRRLLPLVGLLLVAIVAVPILLSGKGEEEESTAPPITSVAGSASQASFSVVPAEPGLRDYRKRLGHRQALNPFRQPKPPRKESPKSDGASTGGGGAGGGEGSAAVSVETSTPEAPSSGSSGDSSKSTKVVVQNQVVGYTIDVEAGYENPQPIKGLKPIAEMPSKKNPLVAYIGLSEDHKRALFLMDGSVTAYYGKAQCSFDKQNCQVVEMKPGTSETFATGFGKSEKRYKVVLEKINRVVTSNQASSKTTTKTKSGE